VFGEQFLLKKTNFLSQIDIVGIAVTRKRPAKLGSSSVLTLA
jgi:hypothetical protein